MKPGQFVRDKNTGQYGSVHWSRFGISIHIYDEKHNTLSKTLGDRSGNSTYYYDVLDEMPEGYEWNDINYQEYIRLKR